MQTQKLNFREFWDVVGTDNMLRIAKSIGSSQKMFQNLRYGMKYMSPKRADLIVKVALKLTGMAPDHQLLIDGVPKANRFNLKIMPSAEFLASRKAAKAAKATAKIRGALAAAHKAAQLLPARLPAPSTVRGEILDLLGKGKTKAEVCVLLGVHRATVNRAISQRGE
jgi:plasmid maintenance system antidote protein VapI